MKIFKKTEIDKNSEFDKKELSDYMDDVELSKNIKQAINEMFEVILPSKDDDIIFDFDDFKVIMDYAEKAFSGIGEYEGTNPTVEAIKKSIMNSSLSYKLMNKISGVLVHFVLHPDSSLMDIADAMSIIHENTNDKVNLAWGTTTDEVLNKDYAKVTIFFTGLKENDFDN